MCERCDYFRTLLDPLEPALHDCPSPDQPDDLRRKDGTYRPCGCGVTADPLAPSPWPELGQKWIHSHWQNYRQKTYAALQEALPRSPGTTAFSHCGSFPWVVESVQRPGDYKIRADWCRNRWCWVCAGRRSRIIASNLADLIGTDQVRFLTLTLKHSGDPLEFQIKRILQCFGRLRRCKEWKKHITAGVFTIEITAKTANLSESCAPLEGSDLFQRRPPIDNKIWHVHLHAIVTGRFFPQALLREMWWNQTGDSYIVDIRKPAGKNEVVKYVCKYVSKPLSAELFKHHRLLVTAIKALHGQRMIAAFGKWAKAKLTKQPEGDSYEPIMPLGDCLMTAMQGNDYSRRIIEKLRQTEPLARFIDDLAPPDPLDC